MLDSNVHAQKIIGRQSFADHVIKSRPMKRQQNLLYFDHNGIVQLGTELNMPFHLVYLVETLNGYTFFSFLYLTDGKRNKQEPITRRAELPHILLRDPRCFLGRSPGEHWGRGETNLTGASLRWNVPPKTGAKIASINRSDKTLKDTSVH